MNSNLNYIDCTFLQNNIDIKDQSNKNQLTFNSDDKISDHLNEELIFKKNQIKTDASLQSSQIYENKTINILSQSLSKDIANIDDSRYNSFSNISNSISINDNSKMQFQTNSTNSKFLSDHIFVENFTDESNPNFFNCVNYLNSNNNDNININLNNKNIFKDSKNNNNNNSSNDFETKPLLKENIIYKNNNNNNNNNNKVIDDNSNYKHSISKMNNNEINDLNELYEDDLDDYKEYGKRNKTNISCTNISNLNKIKPESNSSIASTLFSNQINNNSNDATNISKSNAISKIKKNPLSNSSKNKINYIKRHSLIGDCGLGQEKFLINPNIGKNEFQLPTKPPIKVTIERTSSISSIYHDSLYNLQQACKVCSQSQLNNRNFSGILECGVGSGVGSAGAAYNQYLHRHSQINDSINNYFNNNNMTANNTKNINLTQSSSFINEKSKQPYGLIESNASCVNQPLLGQHRTSVNSVCHSHTHVCPHQNQINNINNNILNECECEKCSILKDGTGSNNLSHLNNEDLTEPKATYSYLKSYFVSMLQPSDNKLAMKLFGSKKGVLKEKLRQQEVGHWIIHPCSNFR